MADCSVSDLASRRPGRLHLVGVSGSTRRPSRTTALVEAIARAVERHRPTRFELVDIAGIGPGLGAFSRAELPQAGRDALALIEGADALIVGTPIHNGSYPGLFKHLFDLVDPAALAGKPVILAATGGGHRHALAIEHGLRPLFGFFSALTVPTSVYAGETDMADGAVIDPVTLDRIIRAAAELATLAPRAAAVPLERAA